MRVVVDGRNICRAERPAPDVLDDAHVIQSPRPTARTNCSVVRSVIQRRKAVIMTARSPAAQSEEP